jgi:uncharacterized membrane protein HdeD (DUF308 family)
MNMALARNWWAVALRGVLAILIGVFAFLSPGAMLASLVLLFAAYSFVDGVFSIIAGLRAAQRHERWWPLALEGLVSILAGALALMFATLFAVTVLYLISAWAIVTGLFRIAAAVRLRREIQGEWLLILNGALSVALGVILALFPGPGLVTLAWLLGFYAIVFGVILVALAFRLKGHGAKLAARPARAR